MQLFGSKEFPFHNSFNERDIFPMIRDIAILKKSFSQINLSLSCFFSFPICSLSRP